VTVDDGRNLTGGAQATSETLTKFGAYRGGHLVVDFSHDGSFSCVGAELGIPGGL
jgi:hypothetical protein